MSKTLRVAFVGGPMYDGLYERLPEFESSTGLQVEIAFKGDHPALNEFLEKQGGTMDVVSTHSKYAPSQVDFLRPLDDLIPAEQLTEFAPATLDLMRFKGALWQLPRLIDSKIFFYRRDLFEDQASRNAFAEKYQYHLKMPKTWDQLVQVSTFLKDRTSLQGFIFPGKESGLFGHFYEILESAGGVLFDETLNPGFVSDAGRYALSTLVQLYQNAAPKELIEWHYDDVAAYFLKGKAALTTDWPGAYHQYQNSATVGNLFDVGIYPEGPAGRRKVYSGGHSFALTIGTRDVPAAQELLTFLTSEASQLHEARLGSVVPRTAVLDKVRRETLKGSREAKRWKILNTVMQECMCIPPKFSAYPACEDALWLSFQKALTGQLGIDEALKAAAAASERLIKAGGENGKSTAEAALPE